MHSLQVWGHSLSVFKMEIYNSKFKYICLSNLCSYWIRNCAHRLPVKWPNPHWNKRPFKWIFLDGIIPVSKAFTGEGSQLLHTILWLTIPNHQFCFLMESFICNWCTAIHYHSNENILHSDPTLRLLSCCFAIIHVSEKHIDWACWAEFTALVFGFHLNYSDVCSFWHVQQHELIEAQNVPSSSFPVLTN